MAKRKAPAGAFYCECDKCAGGKVSESTFYRHQRKQRAEDTIRCEEMLCAVGFGAATGSGSRQDHSAPHAENRPERGEEGVPSADEVDIVFYFASCVAQLDTGIGRLLGAGPSPTGQGTISDSSSRAYNSKSFSE